MLLNTQYGGGHFSASCEFPSLELDAIALLAEGWGCSSGTHTCFCAPSMYIVARFPLPVDLPPPPIRRYKRARNDKAKRGAYCSGVCRSTTFAWSWTAASHLFCLPAVLSMQKRRSSLNTVLSLPAATLLCLSWKSLHSYMACMQQTAIKRVRVQA